MNKKIYEKLEMEVIAFDCEDIISTSPEEQEDPNPTHNEGTI